ncbi:sodium- and chloride-dependent GABA transporter 2-like isoform X1 [Styela clava]
METKAMLCEKRESDVKQNNSVERITWNNKYEFAFSVLGYCIGLGNIWRFSYLCFKNGGGAFLIPFLLVAGLGSLPLVFMEISLGQFTRRGCIAVWNIVPLMRGIGFSSMLMSLYFLIYFVYALGWCLLYLIHSFTLGPPAWATCDNVWNSIDCVPIANIVSENNTTLINNASSLITANSSGIDNGILATEEFWDNYVLQRSDGIHNMGSFSNWKMVGCFIFSWIACYLCIVKGIRTSGKVAYVTVIVPYILMIALFIRGITLKGAGSGMLYYITPNITRLVDPTVWLDAGSQVLFSIGVCYGVLFGFGSYNRISFNCYKSAYFFVFACYGSSLFFGFVVFCFIGHLASVRNMDIEDVVEGGPGLVFQVFPAELALLPLPQVWSAIFFITLASLALDSAYATAEGCITALADYWPEKFSHRGAHVWRAGVCVLAMLLGIPQLFDGGIYVFELFNLYGGSGICILWVAIFESIAVGWIYGVENLYEDVKSMIGYYPPAFFKYCIKYITPAFCLVIFVSCCVRFSPLKMGAYVYPGWANVIGWMISISVVSCIPITAVYVLWKTPGSLRQRFKRSIRPIKMNTQHDDEKDGSLDI